MFDLSSGLLCRRYLWLSILCKGSRVFQWRKHGCHCDVDRDGKSKRRFDASQTRLMLHRLDWRRPAGQCLLTLYKWNLWKDNIALWKDNIAYFTSVASPPNHLPNLHSWKRPTSVWSQVQCTAFREEYLLTKRRTYWWSCVHWCLRRGVCFGRNFQNMMQLKTWLNISRHW